MARFKNVNWKLEKNLQGQITSWVGVQVAVLMDIRDELQTLNRLLGCHNFVDVPHKLERIAANTAKPKRKVKSKA